MDDFIAKKAAKRQITAIFRVKFIHYRKKIAKN